MGRVEDHISLCRTFIATVFHMPNMRKKYLLEPSMIVPVSARHFYECMLEIDNAGGNVNEASVRIQASRRDVSNHVNPLLQGPIADVQPRLEPIVQRIRELAHIDGVLRLQHQLNQAVNDGKLAEAREISERITAGLGGGEVDSLDRYSTLPLVAEETFEEMRARAEGRPSYVPTGIRALDAVIGGVEYGDLVVMGGDTSAGKSSTAILMACEMARRGHRPGFISFEDPKRRMGTRILSMLTGIPAAMIRRGPFVHYEERLKMGVIRAQDLQVHLAFRIGEDLDAMVQSTRALMGRGCDVIFLDYVQAVEVPATRAIQDQRIAVKTILAAYKRELAKGDAVGFALSQFRKREKPHERPSREDLYESAYLAQKAEAIILLWQDADKVTRGILDKAKDDATGQQFMIERDPSTGLFREVGV